MTDIAKSSVKLVRVTNGPSPRIYKSDNIGRIVVAPGTINEADGCVDPDTWRIPPKSLYFPVYAIASSKFRRGFYLDTESDIEDKALIGWIYTSVPYAVHRIGPRSVYQYQKKLEHEVLELSAFINQSVYCLEVGGRVLEEYYYVFYRLFYNQEEILSDLKLCGLYQKLESLGFDEEDMCGLWKITHGLEILS